MFTITLIRTGDFYEAFHDDAKYIARTLGLALTTRSKRDEFPVPMAGFPFHQLDRYVAKIAASGKRVVVCDVA